MPPLRRSLRRLVAAPWRLPVAAVLWLAASAALRAEEFFAVRDQNPLLRGFYLPLPSDAREGEGAAVSATLLVSNTLNVESNSRESLLIDGESAVPRCHL